MKTLFTSFNLQENSGTDFISTTRRILFKAIVVISGLMMVIPFHLIGSDFFKLKNDYYAVTLSGGKIATFTPPPLNVVGVVNLPGDHICKPLVLKKSPAAQIGGWFIVPTTGGNITVLNSSGVILNSYNLPGEHTGLILDFYPHGNFAVQTTGGLFSFFSPSGVFLGTINLPGDHGMKPAMNADSTLFAIVNQNNEIFIIGSDPTSGSPIQLFTTINCPGSPAFFEWGILINQNNQIFGFDGKMKANLPGAFAFCKHGALINQNNQIFNVNIPGLPPLNLPGAPAAPPIAVAGGNVLLINQNFQIFNANVKNAAGPKQNGQALNLPGAPCVKPSPDSLIIAGGANAGKFLAVNQNGQVWVVNPGDSLNGPSIVGGPINLANSPLYVVRNGIPGVYVIASTGGHVDIIDARGPGGPVVIASFNFAGEHTGEPIMIKGSDGTNYAQISTTSGIYIINKSDFTYQHIDEAEMDGQMVCCMGPVMTSDALAGQLFPVQCDLSMAGEMEPNNAMMTVWNSTTGEIVFTQQSFMPPFENQFPIPAFVPPGESFTVMYEVYDFGENPIGQGTKILNVIGSFEIQGEATFDTQPEEIINPTFNVINLGNEPLMLHLTISNIQGWPCFPESLPLQIFPGDTSIVVFESFVPENQLPGTNRFTLEGVNFSNPIENYSDYIDVNVTGAEQTYNLSQGWSGFSTYLNPLIPDVDQIFAPVASELIILMSMNGVYWPAQNVNTLGGMNFLDGFKLKMSNDMTLTVTGTRAQNQILDLLPGWHIIPVLSEISVLTETVLNDPGVLIAKEISGNKVYWPAMSIYTLNVLETGKAYLVYLSSPTTITFPAKGGDAPEPMKEELLNSPWNSVVKTGSTHIIALSDAMAAGLDEGDLIGTFNSSGVNVGLAEFGSGNNVLVIYGDDPFTVETDGMLEGEEIRFKVYRQKSGEIVEINPTFSTTMPNNGNYFVTDGISAIDLLTAIDETGDSISFEIYPNPVSDNLNIRFSNGFSNNITVEILNLLGGHACNPVKTTNTQISINLSHLAEGCYLVRVSNGEMHTTRKIIVQK